MFKLAILVDMLLNPRPKMTKSFANLAGTSASTSKFIYLDRFQIIKNWVFIQKITFNFD